MKKAARDLCVFKTPAVKAGFILISILAVDFMVLFAGGTEFAFTHLMYIPIILSAFFFGIKGAIVAALLAGISLGPWMPVNVKLGVMQSSGGWALRTAIFVLTGTVLGDLMRQIRINMETRLQRSWINEDTGLPNIKKLKMDIDDRIRKREEFSLVVVRITNLDHINRYVDYRVGEKAVFKVIGSLESLMGRNVYSVFPNEVAVILPGYGLERAYAAARKFQESFQKPVVIGKLPVSLITKCGISNYPLHGGDPVDLFKTMGRTLDQDRFDGQGIAVYDDSVSRKNKEKYETLIALYEALKNDEFTLVYQPIFDLNSNKIAGAEALLRWENSRNMNTAEFIQIAEDAGIIGEITKWVLENVICQLKKWQEQGVKIKASINLSPRDLKSDVILRHTENSMQTVEAGRNMLDYELTERVLIENISEVEELLHRIRAAGSKILLDDFGTGYNSLIQLIRLPIDCVKVDKAFIDHIDKESCRILIQEIISTAHQLGKEVIAEGVETEEQMLLLKKMKCDQIQGYYFSKPLRPEEFREFCVSFDLLNV